MRLPRAFSKETTTTIGRSTFSRVGLCIFLLAAYSRGHYSPLQSVCGFSTTVTNSRRSSHERSASSHSNGREPPRRATRSSSTPTTAFRLARDSRNNENGKGDDDNDDDTTKITVFPDYLIEALDLVPLLRGVALHTGTRRGHQAMLSLVKEDQTTVANKILGQRNDVGGASSRRLRAEGSNTLHVARSSRSRERISSLVPLATSAEEARQQYDLVEAATLALSENSYNLTYPPLYGADSNPGDTSITEDTDNDEWLTIPADAWTLENLLQAEKVIETLLKAKDWAQLEPTQTWIPVLSQIAAEIDESNLLPTILEDCAGRVEVVQVRTLSNPTGKAVSTAGSIFQSGL
jgi:hypothetical protein